MADNNIYGVDFIARCMAGEALDKAGQKSWTLVAGNKINILSDEEEKTETISADVYDVAAGSGISISTDQQTMTKTISADIEVDDALSSTSTNPVENRVIYDALQNVEIDVDDALSTTSENPVQNKVITAALKTKPTSVLPNGTVINDQKIMALTRAQYNAIQNKDPNTYYMITDDPVPEAPMVVRTGYKSVLNDYTSSYDANGNWILTFQPEVSFEKLDVYLQWHFDWSAGTDWPLRTATRSIMLSLTKDVAGPVVSTGMNLYLANSANQTENPNANLLYDVLAGSINVNYDEQTNTVTMLVAKPMMDAVSDPGNNKNNLPVVMTNCVANAFGYVAYGPDTINVTTGLTAGAGIDMTNDVISVDMPVGSEIGLSINPSTYVLTATLYDQNTVPINSASVDLPLESMVVSGQYDDTTKKIILTLQSGQTVEFSVADLVSGLQTELSATNKLNPAYINYDSTHAAVSDTEKSTWSSKQNAIDSSHKLSADLVDDTSTTNKFATAEELEQISTNKNNILSNKNEVDYVGSTVTNTKRNGGSAIYDDITALDVLIPLTFEMTGTQYESFTVAVADNNSLANVEYYENVNPANALYIKPHYPTTYIRCMDVSGVYINSTYPVDINKIISGSINGQSTYIGLGKDKPNCALSVAVGYNSESGCTGQKNTTVGVENLIDTTGVRNTSVGYHSLYRCTSGTDNAAIGAESGDDTTTGIQNTALGAYSLQRNAVGNNNTAVGFQALKGGQSSFTSSAEFNGNTVVGVRSMKNMTAGDYNTAIGYQSLTSSSNRSGCIAVGANADCTKDNQMMLGSDSITEVVFCGNKKINFNNDGTVTWETLT